MKDIYSSATKLSLLIMVISIVGLAFMQIEVTEPLKTLAIMIISYYFGAKSNSINV